MLEDRLPKTSSPRKSSLPSTASPRKKLKTLSHPILFSKRSPTRQQPLSKNEEILSATKNAKLLFGTPSTVKHSKGTDSVPSKKVRQLEDLSGTSSSEEEISAESHQGSTVELIKEIQLPKQEKTRSGKCVLMYVYRSMHPRLYMGWVCNYYGQQYGQICGVGKCLGIARMKT